jgi:acetoin utilization protein AcuB
MSNKRLTLASVITPFPYSIHRSSGVEEAKALMAEHGIHHAIVVDDDGDICGMISEADIHQHDRLYGVQLDSEICVADLCTRKIVVASIHDPLEKVLDAMVEQHLDSVAVLKDGDLVGIFTTTDACRCFAQYLREANPDYDTPDLIA